MVRFQWKYVYPARSKAAGDFDESRGTIVIFGLANSIAPHRFGVRFSFVLLAVGAPVPVGRFYSGAIVGRKTKPN